MKKRTRQAGRVRSGYHDAFKQLYSTAKPDARKLKADIDPAEFYRAELPSMKPTTRRGWVDGGLCPFHNDHNPGSWRVNADTGAYRCFSCGSGGSDIIAFLIDRDGITFREALRQLVEDWEVGA